MSKFTSPNNDGVFLHYTTGLTWKNFPELNSAELDWVLKLINDENNLLFKQQMRLGEPITKKFRLPTEQEILALYNDLTREYKKQLGISWCRYWSCSVGEDGFFKQYNLSLDRYHHSAKSYSSKEWPTAAVLLVIENLIVDTVVETPRNLIEIEIKTKELFF